MTTGESPGTRGLDPLTGLVMSGLSKLLIVLMTTMVLDVTWQVISRFVMNRPSSFTEELAGFLLIWIGLLGAAYAFHTRAHLGIDLIREKVGAAGSLKIDLVVNLMVILFALTVMVLGGLNLVILAFQLGQISAAMGIGMGYVYLALPLSGFLIILFAADAISRSRAERAVG